MIATRSPSASSTTREIAVQTTKEPVPSPLALHLRRCRVSAGPVSPFADVDTAYCTAGHGEQEITETGRTGGSWWALLGCGCYAAPDA